MISQGSYTDMHMNALSMDTTVLVSPGLGAESSLPACLHSDIFVVPTRTDVPEDRTKDEQDGEKEECRENSFDPTGCMSPGERGSWSAAGRHWCTHRFVCDACMLASQGALQQHHETALCASSFLCPPLYSPSSSLAARTAISQTEKQHTECVRSDSICLADKT